MGRDAKAVGPVAGRGLALAVLRHVSPRRGDAHADLLIEPPAGRVMATHDGSAGLWTLRLPLPAGDPTGRCASGWLGGGGCGVVGVELAPHRRVYLTRQGPLDGLTERGAGRGSVVRLDAGVGWASRWDADGVELATVWRGTGAWRLRLARLSGAGVGARWRLGVEGIDRRA
ncbi:MAG: hypothetical protein AAGK09_01475 [Planctomycetota bacterium]